MFYNGTLFSLFGVRGVGAYKAFIKLEVLFGRVTLYGDTSLLLYLRTIFLEESAGWAWGGGKFYCDCNRGKCCRLGVEYLGITFVYVFTLYPGREEFADELSENIFCDYNDCP